MSKKLLITIDGPSSSGKGTIAKKIAAYFNLPCLNSGALYRGLAYLGLKQDINWQEITDIEIANLVAKLLQLDLEDKILHNEKIGEIASIIAGNQKVRQALLSWQKDFARIGVEQYGGAVIEGRDIGTIICPDANYKFFLTASVEKRALRRYEQLKANGLKGDYEEILVQLEKRDQKDLNREIAPLKKAVDAIEIDSSELNIEEVFNKIINIIKN